jgi:hypothetical protein
VIRDDAGSIRRRLLIDVRSMMLQCGVSARADRKNQPTMSVTFSSDRIEVDYETPATFLHLANKNAEDLLEWVGIESEKLNGEIPVVDLIPLCRRRLWPIPRNVDPGSHAVTYGGPGTGTCRVVDDGRRPQYLPEKTACLLALCFRAGGGVIRWA